MARTLFRDRALAGQASTDVVDEPVRLVTVPTWAALSVALFVLVAGALWLFGGTVAVTAAGSGAVVNEPTNTRILAPVDGVLVETAEIGEVVQRGQPVSRIAAQGVGVGRQMVDVRSPVTGTVVGVGPGDGAAVAAGDYVVSVAPDSSMQLGYLYVPASQGEQVRVDMEVRLSPASSDPTLDGLLLGDVTQVSPLPVPESRIAYVLADPAQAARLAATGEFVEVTVLLRADPATPTGLQWTMPPGPAEPLTSGIPTTGTIVLAELAPYRAFLGG